MSILLRAPGAQILSALVLGTSALACGPSANFEDTRSAARFLTPTEQEFRSPTLPPAPDEFLVVRENEIQFLVPRSWHKEPDESTWSAPIHPDVHYLTLSVRRPIADRTIEEVAALIRETALSYGAQRAQTARYDDEARVRIASEEPGYIFVTHYRIMRVEQLVYVMTCRYGSRDPRYPELPEEFEVGCKTLLQAMTRAS